MVDNMTKDNNTNQSSVYLLTYKPRRQLNLCPGLERPQNCSKKIQLFNAKRLAKIKVKTFQLYKTEELQYANQCLCFVCVLSIVGWFLVFNATFSNISAISWRPVLVMEEAGVPRENHRPWTSNL